MATSSSDGLIIPIIIDNDNLKSGLKETDKILSNSFDNILGKVNNLSNKSVFTLNTKELDKSINEIEGKIKKLGETKAELQLNVPTESTKKQITEIDKRLNSLNLEKQLKIDVSNASKTSLKDIDKQIGDLRKKKNDIVIGIDYQNAKSGTDKIDKELDDLERVRNIKIELDNGSVGRSETDTLTEGSTNDLEYTASEAQEAFDIISGYASDLGNAIVDFHNQQLQNQIDNIESAYEKESDLLDKKYEDEQDAYADQLDALDEMKEEHQEKLDEINEERDELESEKKSIMSEEDYLSLQEKIKAKEAEAEKEKNILDDIENKNDNTLLNQELAEQEYQRIKEEREKSYLIKKSEIERKQAIASKSMALFDATVALALGILTATTANVAFPWMIPVMVSLISAAGVLQIATIAATQLPAIPSFSMGGLVPSPNDFLFPNVEKPKDNRDRTLLWAGEGERILSIEQNRMYENMMTKETYNSINNNSSHGDVYNDYYNINVSVPSSNASPHTIAKAVVKAIGRRI